MTREEALHWLDTIPTIGEQVDALEMAIKALEQCEVWNGIHGQVVAPKGTFDKIWEDADKEEQEPCEDCISRKDTIDWLKQVTVTDGITFETGFKQILHDIEQMPSVKQKPKADSDCISRADALSACDEFNGKGHVWSCIRGQISKLPSVNPKEPKTGHWINKQRLFDSCSAECSSCHKRSNGYMHDNGFTIVSKYYDFCPKCGAKMESEEEQ